LKSTANRFAMNARVGGNVFYTILIGIISRKPRKFMKPANF
jgi:hypothetical protein